MNERNPSGVIKLYRPTLAPPEPPKNPFQNQAVRIRNPEELSDLKVVLDILAAKLTWEELPPMLAKFEEQLAKEEKRERVKKAKPTRVEAVALRLVQQHPRAMARILRAYSEAFHKELEVEDFPDVAEILQAALHLIIGREKDMIQAQISLMERLEKEESPEGIRRLVKLMEQHPLPQLTSVTTIITDRINRLAFFEKQIQNDKAYEIRGENSIHNQLKRALWIIDDSYWLLHSNEPLTTFLHKKSSEGTDKERERPDFICANSEDRLVIVELKRPSVKLTKEHVIQLSDYLDTADEFAGDTYSKKAGYLVGNQLSLSDQKFIKKIEGLQYRPYMKLVDDCKRRYQEYIDAVKEDVKPPAPMTF